MKRVTFLLLKVQEYMSLQPGDVKDTKILSMKKVFFYIVTVF